jgi:hypothetical protein
MLSESPDADDPNGTPTALALHGRRGLPLALR